MSDGGHGTSRVVPPSVREAARRAGIPSGPRVGDVYVDHDDAQLLESLRASVGGATLASDLLHRTHGAGA